MTILNTSVSGMLADSNWLSSISQNVANASTTGYKNQETDFSTVVELGLQHRAGRRGHDQRALAQRASRKHRLVRDVHQSRRSRLGIFRRLGLERRHVPHAQRLLRGGRVRKSRQQRRLLPDGQQHSERLGAAGERAEQPAEGQCRVLGRDRLADNQRIDRRQPAFDRDAGRRRQPAVDQFGEFDLHRPDLARRL